MIMTARIVQLVGTYFIQAEGLVFCCWFVFVFLIRRNVLEAALGEKENDNLVSKLYNRQLSFSEETVRKAVSSGEVSFLFKPEDKGNIKGKY